MCRVVVTVAVAGCLCAVSFPVEAQNFNRELFASEKVYELHVANPAFRRCDTNRDGALQPEELGCYDTLPVKASYMPPPPVEPTPIIVDAALEARSRTSTAARTAKEDVPPDPLAASNDTLFLLRRSRDAIGSFANPKPFADAAGAEFAWSSDRVADNDVWSARGIAAVSFVHYGEVQRYEPYIDTLTLAPYVNFDRVSNSTKVTSDVDNLTYGGVFEAGFANVFGATQYLDISGEAVSSFEGQAKNWSIDFQWQPVGGVNPEGGNTIFSYLGTPLPLGRLFLVTLSPRVNAEYTSDLSDAAAQPIFAERDEAFRTGPAVTLAIDGKKEFAHLPWWTQRLHYEITYGWLYDWLSSRNYELLDTSLTFALDPEGHLGLTLGYRNGELVETGQDVDLATIALSASY